MTTTSSGDCFDLVEAHLGDARQALSEIVRSMREDGRAGARAAQLAENASDAIDLAEEAMRSMR